MLAFLEKTPLRRKVFSLPIKWLRGMQGAQHVYADESANREPTILTGPSKAVVNELLGLQKKSDEDLRDWYDNQMQLQKLYEHVLRGRD